MASRDNHYVPRWYQEGFFEPGQSALAYLDLQPVQYRQSDGSLKPGKSLSYRPTSRCFVKKDLYTTFFGEDVNDEIERMLFGAVDRSGAPAVRAFMADDRNEWIRHFQTLFGYIDTQKLRTPKGLAWLRTQYPGLTQNELMEEMQGVRMMNCTIWSQGVREIVSAEASDVKFLITDHPVTIYNPALPPSDARNCYPNDPSIALKGSQTIFPLSRDFCLILTNLEFAQEPGRAPLDKRTFARSFRQSMVKADEFVRTRSLQRGEVLRINAILKARASRYVAAGRKEWLHPEAEAVGDWRALGEPLLPPKNELWGFGGEMFAKMEDGRVFYQDAFGRTEKPLEELTKVPTKRQPNDSCGCGSEYAYRACCATRPDHLRPSWTAMSIRERNLSLYNAILDICGFAEGKSWDEVRRAMTDEKIARLYGVFAAFWPLETDLLQLLPKPDGRPRAVYTGLIHPESIGRHAVGMALYFGEVIIQHPFAHPGVLAKEFSPVEQPQAYRQEVLKAVLTFLKLFPLVDAGLVNLVPDPCVFDFHLRDQMMHMAQSRGARRPEDAPQDPAAYRLMEADARRALMLMPDEVFEKRIDEGLPGLEGASREDLRVALDELRLNDPLISLQPDGLPAGKEKGLLTTMSLAPNFEMAMYLAQATGAAIVTDSPDRWREVMTAMRVKGSPANDGLNGLARVIEGASFAFPTEPMNLFLTGSASTATYPDLFSGALRYLQTRSVKGPKPNVEASIASQFGRIHSTAQKAIAKSGQPTMTAQIRTALPAQGIQDHTINRLLLMSSSEHHLSSVPMAFFIAPPGPSTVSHLPGLG
ncbi:DUF4238 domain-containing protein [Brevundimonas naejangsanensis]|uniref:DUF4238 domain-containing protein n=1 Tax=Brevundimonas naejangsanensis TaxID=588932 RepID=UPI000404E795|nr:DUF4238 domain-containing protein [Brevundimonas naejangsanensis]